MFLRRGLLFVQLAKRRGNIAYDRWLYGRFAEVRDNLKGLVQIDEKKQQCRIRYAELSGRRHKRKGHWDRVADDLKQYFDRLRRDSFVGMRDYVAVLEATGSGTVHAHILVILEEQFRYVKRKRKNGDEYGYIFHQALHDRIKEYWPHHSAISAVYSERASIDYILKYLVKGFQNVENCVDLMTAGGGLSLRSSQRKMMFALYHALTNKVRLIRMSRTLSRREAPILDSIKNNSALPWEFLGLHRWRDFHNALQNKFGISLIDVLGFTLDYEGEIIGIEFPTNIKTTGEVCP
ncbi:MAG: hypothetical protein AB2L13_20965 [Spirochaetota bacterium]